jgi:hypothetical protein
VSLRLLASAACLLPLLAFPVHLQAAEPAPQSTVPPDSSRTRVLVVVGPQSPRSRDDLARLTSPGGALDALQKKGWTVGREDVNQIQIIDRGEPVDSRLVSLLSQLPASEGAVVVAIEGNEIVRSFKRGCTTPLDAWTFGWLMTGNDERPVDFKPEPVQVATTGNYRLRGNHWSIEGDWNPTRESVARHLRAFHPNGIQAGWNIESWSLEELRSLHDDIHDREEGFRGRYSAAMASSTRSSAGGAGVKKPGSTR